MSNWCQRQDRREASLQSPPGNPCRVVSDSNVCYFNVTVEDPQLLPDESARLTSSRLEDWLRQTLQPKPYAPLQWQRRSQQRMTSIRRDRSRRSSDYGRRADMPAS